MMSDQKPKANSSDGNSSFAIKRAILGIVGIGCLVVWVVYIIRNVNIDDFSTLLDVLKSLFQDGANVPPLMAITGRIGLILAVLWFALPSLRPLFKYASSLVLGSLLIILLVLATRPRIVPIVVGVIVVGHTINWVIKSIARAAQANED